MALDLWHQAMALNLGLTQTSQSMPRHLIQQHGLSQAQCRQAPHARTNYRILHQSNDQRHARIYIQNPRTYRHARSHTQTFTYTHTHTDTHDHTHSQTQGHRLLRLSLKPVQHQVRARHRCLTSPEGVHAHTRVHYLPQLCTRAGNPQRLSLPACHTPRPFSGA